MAEKSVTPPGFHVAQGAESASPRMVVTLPDFREVTVTLDRTWQDENSGIELLRFRYSGWLEALIAARIITVEMLETPPKRRRDAEGFQISIEHYWRLREGRRERYYKVRRTVAAGLENRLPGAQAALEAAQDCWEWENKWWSESDVRHYQHAMRSSEEFVTALLRRIMDDTQRARPSSKPDTPEGTHG